MKCSELEEALRKFREENGDLEVCYDDSGRIMDVEELHPKDLSSPRTFGVREKNGLTVCLMI